jgi:hypothetical protein
MPRTTAKASSNQTSGKADPKLQQLVERKLELHSKILQLRAEAAKVNIELNRLGSDQGIQGIIAFW